MKTLNRTAFVTVVIATFASAAMAQSINFTVSTPSGPGATLPDASFGAAAGQAGFWNSHSGTVNPGIAYDLLDLDGNATSVTMSVSNQFFALSSSQNLPGATPDHLGVLAGFWDISGSIGLDDEQESFTFAGLQNGMYNVFTYAMAPHSASQFTRVNVNADAFDGTPGAQVVGGAFGGDFELGITHSLHSMIEVTDGSLVINAASVNFGSIAGLQLQLIPAPGALALLGLAGLVSRRRRRA